MHPFDLVVVGVFLLEELDDFVLDYHDDYDAGEARSDPVEHPNVEL